ncbi:MAG TPA: pilus assembly protein TadG, partial [Rhodospirillales bacterium]
YPSDNMLGTTSTSGMATEMDSRLSAICTNMKAEGIVVYTIMFDLSSASLEALFQACATDTSKYYNSPTTAELERSFRAIAAELKKLRITG